jgi:hypothetical protein
VAADGTLDLAAPATQSGSSVYDPDLCEAVEASSLIPRTGGCNGSALRSTPNWWLLYKSLPAFLDAVLGWLDEIPKGKA